MCTKKTILKGFHRPIGLPAFLSPMGSINSCSDIKICRVVKFHPNCKYKIADDKQGDWNKLFGVCLGITGIHKESVRFGWRYNIDKNKIELCTIVYHDGKPERKLITNHDIDLNQSVFLDIILTVNNHGDIWFDFIVDGTTVYTGTLGCVYALCYYGCGLYFGGKSKAPHKMNVSIEKL